MTHIYNLPNVELVTNNKKVTYLNVECAFDIETTSYMANTHKYAFVYLWAFGIGENGEIVTGRTWDEFLTLCTELQTYYDLSPQKRLVCYVHNLGYEFQFMRKYFNWLEVFSVDERKPIFALCNLGIEFRCSYLLSGYSLATVAKNLTNHTISKKMGDLDYSLIRHHETPITETELEYCLHDVRIVLYYINEQLAQYGRIDQIPKTNTGRVRKFVRDVCFYRTITGKKRARSAYQKYSKIMQDLTLDSTVYMMLKRCFMGGFTHASMTHTNTLLYNVSSVDFTSSYPSVMLSERFPMSRFKPINITNLETFKTYCKMYAMVFDVKFINITPKLHYENYISESKCFILKDEVINNGRVYSASELATTITNIDFDIIEKCYSWDKIYITNAYYAHLNYLPKPIIESVLKLYQDKTTLKDVKGYEVEYLLSKGMLNSIYGMTVTDIVKPTITYTDDWGVDLVNTDDEISKYNDSKNRFLFYAWGVWVTAYARRNLWSGILAVGDDYVYSDTDSLKALNFENHKEYINFFNTQIHQKMLAMMKYYKLDEALLEPKTIKGDKKLIGIWDFEGTYNRFKTLGAKRYLTETNGKLSLTVAGLSKANGVEYMLDCCDNDIEKVFTMFNDNLYIPPNRTGKMTHTYIDIEQICIVKDYLGNYCEVNSKSGIYLEPCEFTLSISKTYQTFLQNLSNGILYKGVKHT